MSDGKLYKACSAQIEALYNQGISRDYDIIPVRDKQGRMYFFATNKTEVLGRGAMKVVHKCYPIKVVNNIASIKTDEPMAATYTKKFNFDPKEIERLNRYYNKTYQPTKIGRDMVVVTEFLPGKTLDDPALLATLKNLPFSVRTQLIQLILLNFNLMHHYTPTTGEAIAHVDIKPANILIDIKYDEIHKKYRLDVNVIDFGESENLENEDAQKLVTKSRKGTPLTMPPEVFSNTAGGIYGVKSDIFMISGLLMIILGEEQPYASRDKIVLDTVKLINTHYDMQHLFEKIEIPNLTYDLKNLIRKMLDRMSSLEVFERPDSDEVLRFFSSLHQIALASDHGQNLENANSYAHLAQMQIIANDLWAGMVKTIPFESYPQLAKQIVNMANLKILDEKSLDKLLQEHKKTINFQTAYDKEKSKIFFALLSSEQKKEIRDPINFENLKEVEHYCTNHPKSLASRVFEKFKSQYNTSTVIATLRLR